MSGEEYLFDEPTVCIAHGRFIPCRSAGEHRFTSNPFWVDMVRDYQSHPAEYEEHELPEGWR